MKNSLIDLQNHLFMAIEDLNDPNLEGEKLDQTIRRTAAVNDLAKTAVANGALMVKLMENLGIPVSDDVPLVPVPKGLLPNSDRKVLEAPRDGSNGAFKRNKHNPV